MGGNTFDPDKYLAEKAPEPSTESFDPDAYLSQEPQPSPLADFAADTGFAIATTGGGAVTGGLLKEGIKKGTNFALPFLGKLDTDETGFITKNRETYIPLQKMESPLETMFKQYQDLSGKTRQTAFDAKNAAIQSLEGVEDWKPQKYFEGLGRAASDPKYSSDVSDERFPALLAEEGEKSQSKLRALKDIDNQITSAENELRTSRETGFGKKSVELEKKLQELKNLKASSGDLNKEIQNAAQQRFEKEVLGTPKEVLETTPYLRNRTLSPELTPLLDAAVSKGRNASNLTVKDRVAQGILPALRDDADFSKFGSAFTDKFKTDMSEEIRRILGEENPRFDEQMKRSSKAIDTQKLFEDTGLKWDKDAQRLDLNTNTLMGNLSDPKMNADKFKRIQDAVRGAQELGIDVEGIATRSLKDGGGVDADLFLKQLEGARIRDKVINKVASNYSKNKANQTAGQMLGKVLTGSAAGGAVAGAPGAVGGAVAGIGSDLFGSRLQEALALARSNPTVKFAGEALPWVGGLIGLGVGASNASAAGFDPATSGMIGVAEAIDPVPFASPLEGVKAVRDLKPDPEGVEGEGTTLVDETGKPISRAQKAYEAGSYGAIPGNIAALAGLVGQGAAAVLDKPGQARSNAARARMEQNLNAFRQLKQNTISVTDQLNEFKSPVQAFQKDDLNNLAQEFRAMGGGAEGFAENLEKAARAEDEDARNRIIHGLSQQPGFRALMNRRNK
jgi:hypothetical protein